jgi:two-component system, OmpR family, sensor histidine kinase KdpD
MPLWQQAVFAALWVFATALIGFVMITLGFPTPEALTVLFVLPVICCAIFLDLRIAFLSVIMAVFAYNWLIIPSHTFLSLWQPANLAKVVVLTLVTALSGALAARIKRLAREAGRREAILSGVYALSQDIMGIANVADMRDAARAKLSTLIGRPCDIVLSHEIASSNNAYLKACFESLSPMGHGTAKEAHLPDLYLPLMGTDRPIGVILFQAIKPLMAQLPPMALTTLAAQTASALEKARLSEVNDQKSREAERERFLSALLSSVSHDFKTPLVTIIGALSSLKDIGEGAQRELAQGGLDEAQKLNRFITNLVEISRLESGIESLKTEPVLIHDLVAGALKTLRPLMKRQKVRIVVAPKFPLLKVNGALMELVLLNLLENALKYGPSDGDVTIEAKFEDQWVRIDVDDDGIGIAKDEREAVFTKFFRSNKGDQRIAGTGLGLYICREIMVAHGGDVGVIDPPDGVGACLRLTLPASLTLALDTDDLETDAFEPE